MLVLTFLFNGCFSIVFQYILPALFFPCTFAVLVASDYRRNFFLLHFIVFIWGWTAVLGKVITLPALKLVWLRIPIALSGILLWLLIKRIPLRVSLKNFLIYFGVGLIVALHWICFYGAVKESNVSVTLACFSTASLFTALIEPLFFRRKILWYEILFGVMVIVALSIIFNVETHYQWGMVLGVLAALTTALFGTINGLLVQKGHTPALVPFYELLGGGIAMTIYVLVARPFEGPLVDMSGQNLFYMLLLGLACTSLPFLISIYILKHLSPYTVALTLNLEVVYGILFALFLLKEGQQLSAGFYIGTAIILSTIFLNAWLKSYQRRKALEAPVRNVE